MAGTVIASALMPFAGAAAGIIALMCLMALSSSVAFPNSGALMSRVVDENHQGQVSGLNNALGAFARVLGPLAAGLVFAGLTIDGPFFLGALIVAPAILLALSAGRAASRMEAERAEGTATGPPEQL
jgi:MFS family permease